jgi:hypothetical protein
MKSKNNEICQYLKISYTEVVVKMSGVCTFYHAWCLETQTSLYKFYRVIKEANRFVGKVMFRLEFEFKTFSTLHIQHLALHVKIWHTFAFVFYI